MSAEPIGFVANPKAAREYEIKYKGTDSCLEVDEDRIVMNRVGTRIPTVARTLCAFSGCINRSCDGLPRAHFGRLRKDGIVLA